MVITEFGVAFISETAVWSATLWQKTEDQE